MVAEENLVAAARGKTAAFKSTVAATATILLGAPTAIGDAGDLWIDAETTGINGNVKFFTNNNFSRNFTAITAEIQQSYVDLGLLPKAMVLADAGWDYSVLAIDLKTAGKIEAPRFDTKKLTAAVTAKAATGDLDKGALFTFEINFKPNVKEFPVALYMDAFKKVIDLSNTYSGAVITVEGHSDPYGYQKKQEKGVGEGILSKIKQSGRTLSIKRAGAVRDAIIALAEQDGITIDKSQFVAIGLGISSPKNAIMPKSIAEWTTITAQNRRVVFKLINIEAESSEFEAL